MLPNYKWSHLEDISNPSDLTDGELTPLLEVWKDQRNALPDDGGTAEFSKRLSREWAIETGIIERAYTLDRGTTETLINEGIKASLITRESTNKDPEELAAILQDHLDALEGLFAFVKGERELTTSYIKEVHSALLRHAPTHTVRDPKGNFFETELAKGAYKTLPNNPTRPNGNVHAYCPPEHVAAEMDRMIELYRSHAEKHFPPEVEAAWLHHAFTQIHPFADGNGRVARLLASLVFIKADGFPLLVRRDDQAQYIDALETADRGDSKPLVRFFVRAQRRATLGALQALPRPVVTSGIAEPVTPEQAIARARELLLNRGEVEAVPASWELTNEIANEIFNFCTIRLESLTRELREQIGRFASDYRFSYSAWRPTDAPTPLQRFDYPAIEAKYGEKIRKVTAHFGHEPNIGRQRFFALLEFETPRPAMIVFSLHGVGRSYRGIKAAVLFFTTAEGAPVPVNEDPFQVNYKDGPLEAQARFGDWLEKGLTKALTLWREQL